MIKMRFIVVFLEAAAFVLFSRGKTCRAYVVGLQFRLLDAVSETGHKPVRKF
jgi:hypothetical protein